MYVPNNILVTGGCGFIGSALVYYLLKLFPECLVVTYDKIAYCSKPNPLLNMLCSDLFEDDQSKQLEDKEINDILIQDHSILKRHVLIRGDICDQNLLSKVLDQYKIDTIMHLAAETHVDKSFQHSLDFTKTNVLGTHILLQCCFERKDQIKRFIHVSTDEVYGEHCDENAKSYNEYSSVLSPTNPYAATKVGAEALVTSYVHSFQMPCIITRGNNVYGPGQFPEKVIPKFICRLLDDKLPEIHGSGNAKRNFLYIEDSVKALVTILQYGTLGSIYNIAGTSEITIEELAKQLTKILVGNENVLYAPDRQFNDQRYHIDSTALCALGWKPEWSLDEGLQKTIQWYQKNKNDFWWWNDYLNQALDAHPNFIY